MGLLQRSTFDRGWMPNADAVKAPANALLRMDNCVLDERGAVALRRGSAKLNANAFSDLDIHSLYTAVLNGTRYRMAGATNAVYANGTSVATGFGGSNDIAFGSHLGQILFARSTTKKKYDGTTVRNWGIAMTGGTPTVAAVAPDGKTFATGAQSESPAFALNEGSLSFIADHAGNANGAAQVAPYAPTARGTITKTFASPQDFTAYDSGGVGTDNDLIQLYLFVTEPNDLVNVRLMIDVNSGSSNPFQDDYYYHDCTTADLQSLTPSSDSPIPASLSAQGSDRSRIKNTIVSQQQNQVGAHSLVPLPASQWCRLTVRRGDMIRVGTTSGKNWSTVIAVRLVVETTTATNVAVDTIRILSTPLTGQYQWVYVLAYNTGTYVALSAPSALSALNQMQAQSATITVPSDTGRDSQANECWLFRMGGVLDAFYRVAVKTGVSGTGSFTISDSASDIDALETNITLQTDNARPPDNIIGIDGPYYDRMFCLTSDGVLYPSRRLNPDSFSVGQSIRVAGADETPYWVRKSIGGLYLGTSKDIYVLEGDGAEQSDGSINFTKRPLNIDHPPISNAVAQDGNFLIYCASDGWRVITGVGSQNIMGDTSLLYRGYTRHGVSPVNLATGRLRATIANGHLVAITPEGTSSTSSNVLHRYASDLQRWYRHTYAAAVWRSVHREPDGTLIAGDTSGFVWQLDTGTGDDGNSIAPTIWTPIMDDDRPYSPKIPVDLRVRVSTGGASISAEVHLDGSDTAATSQSLNESAEGVAYASLLGLNLPDAIQFQLRIGGSCTTFSLYDFGLGYQERPVGVLAWDSGPIDLGDREMVWIRRFLIKILATADVSVSVLFDGGVVATQTVSGTGADQLVRVDLPRGTKGKQPRLQLTSTAPFMPYWVKVIERTSGQSTDKTVMTIQAAAA